MPRVYRRFTLEFKMQIVDVEVPHSLGQRRV